MRTETVSVDGTTLESAGSLTFDSERRARIRVFGSSMRPLIRNGDIVRVESVRGADVRWGEIVVCYDADAGALAHRVLKTVVTEDNHRLLLKGDAAHRCDGLVGAEQVLGRVTTIERDGHLIRVDGLSKRGLGWIYSVSRWQWNRLRRFAAVRARSAYKKIVSFATTKREGTHG